MSVRAGIFVAALVVATAAIPWAQDRAVVGMEKPGPFKPGNPIVFHVKLNEPLPKGAHFDFRISPVSGDEEIALGSGEAVDTSQRVFRVSGTLPQGALPGDWHITVIWLFLPGSGWTHTTIAPNDLKFEVEGKPYPIPTKAEVTVGH
jgi:hypothetical protein